MDSIPTNIFLRKLNDYENPITTKQLYKLKKMCYKFEIKLPYKSDSSFKRNLSKSEAFRAIDSLVNGKPIRFVKPEQYNDCYYYNEKERKFFN